MSENKANIKGKEKTDVIYLVPHTHYDAIWVFNREDYFYINIDLILKKVISLLETTEDYKFLIEQTYLLEEVERRYPELFQKISRYIKAKRIEVAGGEYLMADTMLPQEETLIRNIMTGRRFVKERFGIDVRVMWQADSFGLNGQLPQIYRKSGYKYVAFRRGSPEKKPSEFIWQGLDGTRCLAHFMPLGYRAGLDLEKLVESYRELKRDAATSHILMPSGSGVTMPQENTMAAVRGWNEKHTTRLKIATPTEFFEAVSRHTAELPIREGEMYSGRFSEIFPDVASTRIWLKQALRKYESKLLIFERFATIADYFQKTNHVEQLGNCWKKVLFLSFHDVVPGTGMDEVYGDVRQNIGFLDSQLSYLLPRVLSSIVEGDAAGEGQGDIAVFNPLSWPVANWVEVDLDFDEGQVQRIEGLKSGDQEIDVEVIKFSRYEDESLRSLRIGFVANVPATGYRVYKILEREPRGKGDSFIRLKGNKIENEFFQVSYAPDTGLIEVFKNGKRICQANELVMDEEIGDLYYHKQRLKFPLKTEGGEGVKYGSFKVENFWFDKPISMSPARRVINIDTSYYSLRWPYRLVERTKPLIWKHRFISFSKKVIIYRDIPRIDFVTVVENNHPQIRLRSRFSTGIKSAEYTCDTQFGAINRKTNQYYLRTEGWREQPSGTFPSLRWLDLSDEEKGVTIINKGNPENEVRDGDIYLTLFRSVAMLSSDGSAGPAIPVPEAREIGRHVFEYSIHPHQGDWRQAKSFRHGYEFNYGLMAFQLPRTGKYRTERSFLRVEPDSVIVTALKEALDGDDMIIRLYEASGRQTRATVTLFGAPKGVSVVNLMEEKDDEFDKKIELDGERISFLVMPFEVVTLKVSL